MERTATGEKYELSLMGDGVGLRALSDGRRQSVPTIQAHVVVAYLALERSRPVTRDQLADVLWAGQLPDTWTGSLRNVISRLRAFFADALPGDAPEVIASGHGGTYQFVLPDNVEIDVERAGAALAEARERLANDDPAAAFELATTATLLSERDFLPSVAEVEWVEGRRRSIRQMHVDAWEVVSAAALASGATPAALAAADQACSLAPLRESAYRSKMAAQAAAGNRADALRTYQEMRTTLAEELGVDPSPETEAEYINLLRIGSPHRLPSRRADGELAVLDADTASERDLLGTQRDAAGIARVLAACETSPPLALAILGEWGAGKSTFMNLLRAELDGLARRSAPLVLAAGDLSASPYCVGVRQIRFNAWHYADDHLWAGLIRQILRELADEPVVEAAEHVLAQSERDELNKQLSEAQADLEEVDVELLEAERVPRLLRVLPWPLSHRKLVGDSVRAINDARRLAEEARDRLRILGAAASTALVMGILALILAASASSADSVWRWVAGAVTTFGALTGLLHRWLVDSVGAWRARLSELVGEVAGPPPPDRETQLARRVAIAERIRSLERELADTDPERRLTRFLRDRQDTGDYDPYRGLLSLVHDDLQQLTSLVAERVRAWPSPSPQVRADGRATDSVKPPLQRVVLYIDDLDRCEPHKAVEVLAAIHLILAMELFVVVVAVEPRWLLRCLHQRYTELFDDHEQSLGARTPVDYLEKIFQVAYAVPPMRPGFSSLVGSLMPLRDDVDVVDGQQTEAPAGATAARVGVVPQDARSASGGGPGAERSGYLQGLIADDGSSGRSDGPSTDTGPSPDPPDDVQVELAGERRQLQFTPGEVDAVLRLEPLLRTPRTVKRLVNTYRVIRATSASGELDRLVAGDYTAVLLLLGITLGWPLAAPTVYAAIRESPTGDLRTTLSQVRSSPTRSPQADERLDALLDHITVFLDQGGEEPSDVATYRHWLPAVARCSFDRQSLDDAAVTPSSHTGGTS